MVHHLRGGFRNKLHAPKVKNGVPEQSFISNLGARPLFRNILRHLGGDKGLTTNVLAIKDFRLRRALLVAAHVVVVAPSSY